MAKNYQRDERNWRRQQQNRQEENQWSRGRQEDDSGWSGQGQQGRHWRDQEYNPRGGQETGRYWSRGQGMQGSPEQFGGGSEREVWEGGAGHRWGSERPDWGRERNYGIEGPREWQGERGWERGTEGWQGGRGGGWQGDRWQGVESRGRGWEGDYGTQYGGNLTERYGGLGGRGWYQGWNEAMRGREGQYAGRGPRGYKRSDNRIEEDINERLTEHSMIDASDVEVSVQNGEVTLRGHVDHREAKRIAEDIAESVFGVKEVNNQIKVKQRGESEETKHETETSGKQRKAS